MSVRLSDFASVTTEYNGEAGWLLNIFVFFIFSRLKLYDLGGAGFVTAEAVACIVRKMSEGRVCFVLDAWVTHPIYRIQAFEAVQLRHSNVICQAVRCGME